MLTKSQHKSVSSLYHVISVHCKLPHRKTLNFKSKSIDGCLKYLFGNTIGKNHTDIFMFVCTTDLYEYMNSLRKDVCNLFVNTHVRIQIYREFYLCIIYIANEGRHVRIINNRIKYSLCSTQFTPVCRQWFISSYWQRTFAFKMYDSFNFLLTTLTFKHGRYLQFPQLIIFISWVTVFLPLVPKLFLCRCWYNQLLVNNIRLIWRLWAVRKSQQGVLITRQNVLIVKLYSISTLPGPSFNHDLSSGL